MKQIDLTKVAAEVRPYIWAKYNGAGVSRKLLRRDAMFVLESVKDIIYYRVMVYD